MNSGFVDNVINSDTGEISPYERGSCASDFYDFAGVHPIGYGSCGMVVPSNYQGKDVLVKICRGRLHSQELNSLSNGVLSPARLIALNATKNWALRKPDFPWGGGENYLYYGVDFVGGENLESLITRSRNGLGEVEALKYGCYMAMALEYLHMAGLISRDVKPGNMLGSVAIDGGLTIAPHLPNADCSGSVYGTPEYMSPRAIHGGNRGIQAEDLYAVGLLIYEAVTGMTTIKDILKEQQNGATADFSETNIQRIKCLGGEHKHLADITNDLIRGAIESCIGGRYDPTNFDPNSTPCTSYTLHAHNVVKTLRLILEGLGVDMPRVNIPKVDIPDSEVVNALVRVDYIDGLEFVNQTHREIVLLKYPTPGDRIEKLVKIYGFWEPAQSTAMKIMLPAWKSYILESTNSVISGDPTKKVEDLTLKERKDRGEFIEDVAEAIALTKLKARKIRHIGKTLPEWGTALKDGDPAAKGYVHEYNDKLKSF